MKHRGKKHDALVKAVAARKPVDQLVIAAGTWSMNRMWDIGVSGTADAPIWIVAEESARVILTRPDTKQSVLNMGQASPKFLNETDFNGFSRTKLLSGAVAR